MEEKYVDTVEAGAGSYPEPPESKLKCFKFNFDAEISGYGLVYAEDEEQAKELITHDKYDDIVDTWGMEMTDITKIEVSDEN